MRLSFDRVVLGSIFAECILYGVCLTVCPITAYLLLKARIEGGRAHKILCLTLLLMLILTTTHVALSIAWIFNGFILARNVPGGPSEYFAQLAGPALVVKIALFSFQTLLGDAIHIWRCYVIWSCSKKIIIVPVMTLLAGLVCACAIQSGLVGSLEDVCRESNSWVISGFALMFATAVYCNAAVIWRIWRTDTLIGQSHILIAIFEGGLLYTSSLVVFLVLFAMRTNMQEIALDLIVHFVPIVFCLVVLQIKYLNTDKAPETLVHLDASTRRSPKAGVLRVFRCPKRRQLHAPVGTVSTGFEAQSVVIDVSISMEDCREGEAVGMEKNSSLGDTGSEV
ncbi:hypothetical protein DENSPDRAFT_586310 [Dentipellis sp. KUC8613]|nr:hypothetical protein DENSPDRAFT_586310 [Dentipellis sp. KUC8613]